VTEVGREGGTDGKRRVEEKGRELKEWGTEGWRDGGMERRRDGGTE
jgi:hypothetical protein